MDNFVRFDMDKKPQKPSKFWAWLARTLSKPEFNAHKIKITKEGVDGLKAPFLVLCNHNAFLDFKVAFEALKPVFPNMVVAIDGFIGREWIMRQMGCICKRKFTNDIMLVRHLVEVIKQGGVPCIYPEARYSLCGTNAVLPESLGKLCKMLKVPVLTLICHGHHANAPFWNTENHKLVGLESELKLLFTVDDLENKTVEEINKEINERFVYDDFKWIKEHNVKIEYKERAKGLHHVLYQCPVCQKENRMNSYLDKLACENCGTTWEMQTDGLLKCLNHEDTFTHIPSWYEWERENVKKEVEGGTYSSGLLNVFVRSLPNSKKFIDLGHGTLIHDMNGFKVVGKDADGNDFEMIKDVPSLYSCHIEYNYLNKFGDCIDLNTLKDTWYIYPEGKDFSITKMALATEELYFKKKRDDLNE